MYSLLTPCFGKQRPFISFWKEIYHEGEESFGKSFLHSTSNHSLWLAFLAGVDDIQVPLSICNILDSSSYPDSSALLEIYNPTELEYSLCGPVCQDLIIHGKKRVR